MLAPTGGLRRSQGKGAGPIGSASRARRVVACPLPRCPAITSVTAEQRKEAPCWLLRSVTTGTAWATRPGKQDQRSRRYAKCALANEGRAWDAGQSGTGGKARSFVRAGPLRPHNCACALSRWLTGRSCMRNRAAAGSDPVDARRPSVQ